MSLPPPEAVEVVDVSTWPYYVDTGSHSGSTGAVIETYNVNGYGYQLQNMLSTTDLFVTDSSGDNYAVPCTTRTTPGFHLTSSVTKRVGSQSSSDPYSVSWAPYATTTSPFGEFVQTWNGSLSMAYNKSCGQWLYTTGTIGGFGGGGAYGYVIVNNTTGWTLQCADIAGPFIVGAGTYAFRISAIQTGPSAVWASWYV